MYMLGGSSNNPEGADNNPDQDVDQELNSEEEELEREIKMMNRAINYINRYNWEEAKHRAEIERQRALHVETITHLNAMLTKQIDPNAESSEGGNTNGEKATELLFKLLNEESKASEAFPGPGDGREKSSEDLPESGEDKGKRKASEDLPESSEDKRKKKIVLKCEKAGSVQTRSGPEKYKQNT